MFIEVSGFTIFLLLLGRLGATQLAATNLAMTVNNLAFMPMIGVGHAVMVLVGQYLGKDKPDIAERSAYTGFAVAFVFMFLFAMLYLMIPDIFLMPFAAGADNATFEDVRELTILLLRFVAIYTIVDGMNVVFSNALKGAGDTTFVMIMISILTLVALIAPTIISLSIFHSGIMVLWGILTVFVMILGFSFYFRFRTGKWKSMRVIEQVAVHPHSELPDAPFVE
jgi:MATE family multidrug resistance protein